MLQRNAQLGSGVLPAGQQHAAAASCRGRRRLFRAPRTVPRADGRTDRYFDLRIQSSWGSGPSSSGSSGSGGHGEGGGGGQERFASLFHGNGGGREGSSTAGAIGSSSYAYGGGGSSSGSGSDGVPAGAPPRWVAAALLPTMLWCITWCFTGGAVTLAQSCMSGMVSLAALLFPTVPVKGVAYEDLAVSLAKGLLSGTDSPATWSRPGLGAPAWLLRGAMACMLALASASSSFASALIPVKQWLLLSGLSQGLTYATCLLLMLPLGAGLNSLVEAVLQRTGWRLPRAPLSDGAALALKLAGVLAWPAISGVAVLQLLLAPRPGPPAAFALSGALVGACTAHLLLLLGVAGVAARFAVALLRQRVGSEGLADFGLAVGGLCGAQAVLSLATLCLLAGTAGPAQLAMPLVSTLILGRVAWSTWRLWRVGATVPSTWLQLLTLTPMRAPPAAA